MSLLEVRDLRVTFDAATGPVHAVRGVSFALGRERLGIVGESGSGKTMTGLAILKLVRPPGRVAAKRILFDGHDLLAANERQMRALRGRRMAMVMQDAKYSLNPVMRVGKQLMEGLRLRRRSGGPLGGRSSRLFSGHSGGLLDERSGKPLHGHSGKRLSARDAREQALAMLEAVRIHDAARVFHAWPHELSGGMGQRVMIAMMLAAGPDLLIADEITSALDVTVQKEVLGILDGLVRERGMGLVFISHDLRLVSRFCDRVLVMYRGRVVEELHAARLDDARHPYTRGLLNCLPVIGGDRKPLPMLARNADWAQ